MYILKLNFSDILLRFQLLLFCIAEKILHLCYPFSGVHLGTRPLESNRQVYQYLYIFCFYDHKLGVATKCTTPN